MKYIDTHEHLNLSAFDEDVTEVVARCADEGVAVLNVGTKESTSAKAVALAQEHEHLYAIIGLQPIFAENMAFCARQQGNLGTPIDTSNLPVEAVVQKIKDEVFQ